MNFEGPSLDQLRVLAAVVEHGGFSAAAKRLGRAQSAVTYAVQMLESQLGLPLFDRSGYRPVLNDAGRALLPRVERILKEAAALCTESRGIAGGLEAEVAIVVDAMFPMARLVAVLQDFQKEFPTVATKLFVEALGAATARVLDGTVDIGIVVTFAVRAEGLVQMPLGEFELVVVAAPGHPLVAVPPPLTADHVRDHVQLVLTDRSTLTEGRDHGVMALRTWRLADLGAKHAMLRAGLGWGSMPRHMVAADIAEGRLHELRFAAWDGAEGLPRLPAQLVHRPDRPIGPATRWLLERLATA